MNSRLEPIIRYIISVLLREDKQAGRIAYSKMMDTTALVTIWASDFFDEDVYLTEKSMPKEPLAEWHGIPLLFGEPREEIIDGHLIVHADIIASAFFLMSRYEELVAKGNRDSHGRFMGAGSLPGRAGFLERAIIDEYGKELRDILRDLGLNVAEPYETGKVYLTHDVDLPWKTWSFLSAVRNCLGYARRERCPVLWPLQNYFGDYSHNPFDTFDWIFEQNASAKGVLGDRCQDIYFVIGAPKPDSQTESYIGDEKAEALLDRLKKQADCIGLHISYDAGKNSSIEKIRKEKELLESKLGMEVRANRNHYLLSVEPSSFRSLISVGIKEDYTMGYADKVGFRLGTAQCVRWIDAIQMELTDLCLHPLIVMDGTLAESQYMGLGRGESIEKIRELYEICRVAKGDFCVLFHNSIFLPGAYFWMKEVYLELIEMLKADNDKNGDMQWK